MSRVADVMKLLTLVAVCGVCLACGQKNETTTIPADPPAKGPASTTPVFADVAPIIRKNCAPCHNGSEAPAFPNAAAFRASAAKAELESGGMPKPPVTISPADKAKLLSFLGS